MLPLGVVWPKASANLSSPLLSLNLLSVYTLWFGAYPWLCLPVSAVACMNVVPRKGFAVYLLNSAEVVAWEKNEGFFTEIFNSFTDKKKSYLPGPNCPGIANRHYQAISICILFPIPMVNICCRQLFPNCWLLSADYHNTHICHKRVHNLWLKLCMSLSCKIWLHGKSMRSEVGFILLKA